MLSPLFIYSACRDRLSLYYTLLSAICARYATKGEKTASKEESPAPTADRQQPARVFPFTGNQNTGEATFYNFFYSGALTSTPPNAATAPQGIPSDLSSYFPYWEYFVYCGGRPMSTRPEMSMLTGGGDRLKKSKSTADKIVHRIKPASAPRATEKPQNTRPRKGV